MPDGSIHDWAEQLGAAQAAFWTVAVDRPAFGDASAFAPPNWQAFDSFAARMLAQVDPGTGPDWQVAFAALAAFRDVIAATWARVQQSFEMQRRAMQGLTDPDWRIFRDRWFQIAEAEFIQTQRSPAFLDAQRNLLRVAIDIWSRLPEPARIAAQHGLAATQTAVQTAADLWIDGVQIGQTPKDLIWQSGQTTLHRYCPLDGQAPRLGPVVLCHGLIGRQTMTDLQPDRSLVRQLLATGVDLFVVDWGNAAPEDAALGLDHFAGDMLGHALAQAKQATGKKPVLFGICQGGTMAVCHAARYPDHVAGLITAVAPVDFHADEHDPDPAHGLLHLWLRSLEPGDVDDLIGLGGTLPGALMGTVFNQLNPIRTLAKYAVDMAEQAISPGGPRIFIAMEKWLADRPDLPAAIARTWLRDLYQDNQLIQGNLILHGQNVDLGRMDMSVLNIFASNDHIVPPPCSRALGGKISGKYQELALPTGHIGAFVSARAQTLLSPTINAWLGVLD